jgi:hypothetical protein
MSLTPEFMAKQFAKIIPDFQTAPGQKSALALCRMVQVIFSDKDRDQASVDALMNFLKENAMFAWRHTKYDCMETDQVQERTEEFENHKTSADKDAQVRVHVGNVYHDITFRFPVGTDDFLLEFMPGETINETHPMEGFEEMEDKATPEQMYGSELCYFTVSGRFLKKKEPDETESDEECSDEEKEPDETESDEECSDEEKKPDETKSDEKCSDEERSNRKRRREDSGNETLSDDSD